MQWLESRGLFGEGGGGHHNVSSNKGGLNINSNNNNTSGNGSNIVTSANASGNNNHQHLGRLQSFFVDHKNIIALSFISFVINMNEQVKSMIIS